MNKAVMMSIKPEWCVRIAIGEKTVEVRKTRPKIEPPFKCYIYCTNQKEQLLYRSAADRKYRLTKNDGRATLLQKNGHTIFNGCVIGEFVCDHVIPIYNDTLLSADIPDELMLENLSPCLTDREIKEYLGDRSRGYGWHISDLVIYDTPRPLSDFGLKRPPQSWGYVKEATQC